MKTPYSIQPNPRPSHRAFSLIETLIATAIINIVCFALFAGISSSFALIDQAREELRASQVMLEKMETIRLYSWDQINSNGFITPSFLAPFDPGATNSTNSGIIFQGKVAITSAPITETYSNDVRLLTIELAWTSGTARHTRSMSSFISRQGLQNYIY